jgi:hypothetical protein
MKHKACQERENWFRGKTALRFMSTNPKPMDLAWDIPILRSVFLQYKSLQNPDQSCANGAVAFCCGQQGFECFGENGENEITFNAIITLS